MDKTITSGLRTIFLVHAIVAAVFGVALFLVPGRTMVLVGWVPEILEFETDITGEIYTETGPGTILVDAVMMRVLGAAMLALAFSSYRGWRAGSWGEASFLVQLETAFSVLALLAFLVPVLLLGYGQIGPFWVVSVVLFAGFAIAFGQAWMQNRQ